LRTALLTIAAVAVVVLAACSGSSAGAPFDQQFVDMMVPHHQSAIDAARAAETRAQKPEIKKLAREIVAAQQKEIEQMQQWRKAWYGA
jgi:uncharacterized protein (DUF305 family)